MILTKNPTEVTDIDAQIQLAISENKLHELLCIVPTNRRALQLEMSMLQSAGNGAINPPPIETTRTISLALLREIGNAAQPISETAAHVFLKRCLQENKSLKYFKNYRDLQPDGLIRILRQLFAEWNRHGIAADAVVNEVDENASDYERVKVEEITVIYKSFTEKLRQTGRIDIGDPILLLLNERERLQESFRIMYPDVKTVYVSGYSELSGSEAAFLSSIGDIPGTEIFVHIDYNANNPILFSRTFATISLLKNAGFQEAALIGQPVPDPMKSSIREQLFTYKKNVNRVRFKDYFHLHRANSREDEIKKIAATIKDLVNSKKVNPAEIAVVFQVIHEYSPVIRTEFVKYGIPFNLTDRPVLSSAPAVNAVLNFLKMLESDFYYKDVFRAFSGVYLQIDGIQLAEIVRIAVKYRVISGIKDWLSLENRLQKTAGMQETELHAMRKVEKTINKANQILRPFKGKVKPDEFYLRFANLIREYFFPKKLNIAELQAQNNAATALNALLQSVKEVCDLIALQDGAQFEHKFSYYFEEIQAAINNVRYTLPPDIADSVIVTTPEEIRGMQFKHVFIGGLYDGNLPSRYSPDIFAPKTISRDEKQYMSDQQFVFYEAMLTGSNIHFSYPYADDEKVLNASHFLTSFLKQYEVTEVESDTMQQIYTKEELLSAIGREISRQDTGDLEKLRAFLPDADILFSNAAADKGRTENKSDFRYFAGRELLDKLTVTAQEKLLSYREREYSITQLETYAACPFRFFLERVMSIEEYKEPEEEAGRMEFGTLLHDILFKFLSMVLSEHKSLAEISNEEFQSLTEKLFALALDEIEHTDTGAALSEWDKELILGINGNKNASVLMKFLQYEREQKNFRPVLLESSFGTLSHQAKESSGFAFPDPIVVQGVKLRGKIDRIDIQEKAKVLNVVDYKTGSKSYPIADLNAGLILQLPVYLHAATQILFNYKAEYADYQALYPIIYSLKYNEKKFGMKPLQGKLEKYAPDVVPVQVEQSRMLIDTALQAIAKYVLNISNGEFALTQLQGNKRITYACGYCDFLSICRFTEMNANTDDAEEKSPEEVN